MYSLYNSCLQPSPGIIIKWLYLLLVLTNFKSFYSLQKNILNSNSICGHKNPTDKMSTPPMLINNRVADGGWVPNSGLKQQTPAQRGRPPQWPSLAATQPRAPPQHNHLGTRHTEHEVQWKIIKTPLQRQTK